MCITMRKSTFLICAFSLLFGISGTSEDPASHVGGIRGDRRYLGKKKDNKDRKEEIKALLACKEIEEFYYNALITVEDNSKDSAATRKCTDDDLVQIGMLIQDFVTVIDEDFPPYEGEMIRTNVCIVPLEFPDKDDGKGRRMLETRNKRRYAWRSGGICKRCVDLQDRFLRELGGYDYGSVQQYASAICERAPLVDGPLQVCKEGMDRGREMADDVDEILSNYEGKIDTKLKEQLAEMPKLVKNIQSIYDKAAKDLAENKLACSLANELAAVDDEEEAMKESEKLLKDVDKLIEKGDKAVLDMEFLLAQVKDIKGVVVEADMKYNFKLRQKELKDRLDAEKAVVKEELDRMNEAMKELQDDLKESKSLMDAEEIIEEEAELGKVMLRERTKQEKLEMELKYWTEDMKDEEKYLQTMMELTFEMEYAHTPDEWYENYVEALETALPRQVMDAYSFQSGKGCLDEKELRDFNIIVTLQEVPTRDDTYIDKCEFQYPEP